MYDFIMDITLLTVRK